MNDAERCAVALLEHMGFTVYRAGWPDFLAVRGEEVVGVEHKNLYDELRPNQVAMRAALAAVLPVVVIRTGHPSADGARTLYRENGFPWQLDTSDPVT